MGQISHRSSAGAFARPRVLVTDAGARSVEPLLVQLEELRCNVRLAADGPSTVQQALVFRPDLVLVDLGSPLLDGFEVARSIRRHATLARATLIAVTAFRDDFYRRHAAGPGFHRYLRKPYDFERLAALITSIRHPVRPSAAE